MGWPCPFRSALKRTSVQDFNSFSIMFYYIFSTKWETYFDLLYFCTFRSVSELFPWPLRRVTYSPNVHVTLDILTYVTRQSMFNDNWIQTSRTLKGIETLVSNNYSKVHSNLKPSQNKKGRKNFQLHRFLNTAVTILCSFFWTKKLR